MKRSTPNAVTVPTDDTPTLSPAPACRATTTAPVVLAPIGSAHNE